MTGRPSLYLDDRRNDMVVSGGVNIYPAEIEAALVGLPAVRDCAVFGVPDGELGEALAASPPTSSPTARRRRLRDPYWAGRDRDISVTLTAPSVVTGE